MVYGRWLTYGRLQSLGIFGLRWTLSELCISFTMTTTYAFECDYEYVIMTEPKPAAEFTEEELNQLDDVLEAYFGDVMQVFGGEPDVIEVSSIASR